MLSSISDILDDLYSIDPSLREHEQELVPLLEKLIEHRPDVKPDEAFVRELRSRLVARAREAAHVPAGKNARITLFTMQRFTPILAGLVVGAILTAPATYFFLRPEALPVNEKEGGPLFSYSIRQEAAPKAFGDLSAVAPLGGAQGRGGGGAAADSALLAPETLPAFTQYAYVYEGELPELPATVEVLQREKRIEGPALTSFLRDIDLGMIDLGGFTDTMLDGMTFSQKKDYGYIVNVMLRDGQISLSQDWERWPHPEAACKDEECFKRYRPSAEDVPSDEALIGIADAFLKEHNADLSRYGAPEVDQSWLREYGRAAVKSDVFVPDALRVIYPLLLEGKPVYDMGGAKTGISVGIHVKEKRVTDVWGIQNQAYRSSSYAGVQDAETVKTFLRNLEQVPPNVLLERGVQQQAIRVPVKLGEPTQGYTTVYQQDGVTGKELLVPALVFPVLEAPQDQFYFRTSVAVPLARDVLEKQEGGPVY